MSSVPIYTDKDTGKLPASLIAAGSIQNFPTTTIDGANLKTDHYNTLMFVPSANCVFTGFKIIMTAASALTISGTISIGTNRHFTQAYLTGGTDAESNPATWAAITNGSFRCSLDFVTRNYTGIDFTGVVTMDDVAAVIQTKMRTLSSSLVTVVWSTDHFVITSGDQTAGPEVSVLTTATASVGTDISGAGASDWMDANVGNGVETPAIFDGWNDIVSDQVCTGLTEAGLVYDCVLDSPYTYFQPGTTSPLGIRIANGWTGTSGTIVVVPMGTYMS